MPHEVARKALAEGLIRLGVITQTLDEALDVETGELRKWYMHNTGHWLGLDVHDVGTYKPDGTPRLLEEGMVLTVEPGLTLVPGVLMSIVRAICKHWDSH